VAVAPVSAGTRDLAFRAYHNILPLQSRLHRLFPRQHQAACPNCPSPSQDTLHFFTSCPRITYLWAFLTTKVAAILGGPVPDLQLLFLAWPIHHPEADASVALAVILYIELVWDTRAAPLAPTPAVLKATVGAVAPLRRSIFA
jgi:hypothetical protein